MKYRGRRLTAGSTVVTAILALLFSAVIGCATTSSPKTVTDTKQLVGAWVGYVGCRGCSRDFRTNLLIRDDATWVASVHEGNIHYGVLGIVDGVLRWGQGGRWLGRVTVVEERGREYLTIVRENGSIWSEFERTK
jgi:hypothetical protein